MIENLLKDFICLNSHIDGFCALMFTWFHLNNDKYLLINIKILQEVLTKSLQMFTYVFVILIVTSVHGLWNTDSD